MDCILRYGAGVVKRIREGAMVETGKPVAYSVAEAARLLSISQRKLTYLIEEKEIKSFKIGKSRRITSAALAEFVTKQEKLAAR
jgi:excisionase family DNA binding protein